MRTDVGARREPLDAWMVENVRLTAFTDGNFVGYEANWLSDFIGTNEITVQEDRRTGFRQQTAPYDRGFLTLATGPGLLNWGLAWPADEIVVGPSVPLPQWLDVFRAICDRWFPVSPPMRRLAFGAGLQLSTPDRESGYCKINNYLNFDLNPETSRDFSFQINHPRRLPLEWDDLRVNRLTRWSVAKVVVSPQWQAVALNREPPFRVYCRLELDINTDADREGLLPQLALPALFANLIDYGTEIIAEGDIE